MKTPSLGNGTELINVPRTTPTRRNTRAIPTKRSETRFERQSQNAPKRGFETELSGFLAMDTTMRSSLSAMDFIQNLSGAADMLTEMGSKDSASRYALDVIETHLSNHTELERRMTAMLRS